MMRKTTALAQRRPQQKEGESCATILSWHLPHLEGNRCAGQFYLFTGDLPFHQMELAEGFGNPDTDNEGVTGSQEALKLGTIDGGQYPSASLFPSCGDSTQLRYSFHCQKRGKSRRVAAHSQQRNGGNTRL